MERSIFITGAGAGIGRATAEYFAKREFTVGLFDVDEKGIDETASLIASAGASSSRIVKGKLDVTDDKAFTDAMARFGETTGGALDVMFNCAGILRMGKFDEIALAEYDKEIAINVRGVIIGTRVALPLLLRGAMKRIVNMSSASAVYGTPDLAVYSATKFAVRGLTEALDLELGPRGVRVCDVMPGYVATNMVSSQTFHPKTLDTLGVRLTAEDVAKTVWNAAHGKNVHYFLQNDVALLHRVGNLVPGFGRRIMKRYAGK
jgi:NAD(P)-dependent dehydrogenase (short-subunit alcohol dehydrogenase family)